MASPVELRIFLAGRVAIEADGVVLDEARLAGRQGRLVFAYLVAEQHRPVPRDELAEALWGPDPPATWDKALTVIASKLRSALTEAGVEGGKALTSAFGCYRLDLPEGSWVDVTVAADATDAAEKALAAGDLEEAREGAALAASLMRQPFLPGEDGTWVEEKRRALVDLQGRALTVLTEACLRLGNASEATKWAEQAIILEPFRESGYRRLMEAHAARGNRAEALQVYERCRRLLAEELGAYPSPETDSIYRELLAAPDPDAARGRASIADREQEPAPAPPSARRGRRRRKVVTVAAAVAVTAGAVAGVLATRAGRAHTTPIAANAVGLIDMHNGRVLVQVPVGQAPTAVAVGDGAVWDANEAADTISRIDPGSKSVQTITAGSSPSGITVCRGGIWVANHGDGTVSPGSAPRRTLWSE
jgi:DNA-binding SARP family transcriptional activator